LERLGLSRKSSGTPSISLDTQYKVVPKEEVYDSCVELLAKSNIIEKKIIKKFKNLPCFAIFTPRFIYRDDNMFRFDLDRSQMPKSYFDKIESAFPGCNWNIHSSGRDGLYIDLTLKECEELI
jgi:hypothetical protein